MILRGACIILLAAFIWGIGNAVTGYTAYEYLSSGSLLPAVDIAFANTLGGLLFLTAVFLIRLIPSIFAKGSVTQLLSWRALVTPRTVASSVLKGLNTCLYVFSTTHIVATQSLVLESTYIVWSLLLSAVSLGRVVNWRFSAPMVALLWLGVLLVSGEGLGQMRTTQDSLGAVFGICAGLSYAGFLFTWSKVTSELSDLRSQLMGTAVMLFGSLLTIATLSTIFVILARKQMWMPFENIAGSDALLQTVNGLFVVGVVYLLVTIGMQKLKGVQEGAGFLAALGLSFSIPFTLLPEFAIGKFVPAGLQLLGLLLFLVAFVSISSHLSGKRIPG